MRRPALSLLFISPLAAALAQPPVPGGLEVWQTGSTTDAPFAVQNGPGLILMGGSREVDEAYTEWAFPRLNGGDIVVLRTSGSDGYNDYLYSDLTTGPLQPNSVTTLKPNTRAEADSDYVRWVIDRAEFIWFAGGDQSSYTENWRGTQVQEGIQAAWDRGAIIGGTSAGLAILGEFIFDPGAASASDGEEALLNPYNGGITLTDRLLDADIMDGIITDTHFAQRDRMGRPVAWMARLREEGRTDTIAAIAVDERTALCVDANGQGVTMGENNVYVIREIDRTTRNQVAPGQPLIYRNLRRGKLYDGDTIDLNTWETGVPWMPLFIDATLPEPFDPTDPYKDWQTPSSWIIRGDAGSPVQTSA